MSLLSSIKTILRQRTLNRKIGEKIRNRASTTLSSARDVLVIYDASEEYQNKEAEEFFARLKSGNIRVRSVGFARYNIIPHYCIPQLTRQFICKKDLNWYGVPSKAFLDDFLDEEFDLLISLDLEQDPVLQYMAALSMARFKVGWYDQSNLPWFDFLIKSTPGDMKEYIKQIFHYLSTQNT